MKTYEGDVDITKGNHEDWEIKLKRIKKIIGYLSINSQANLPALETVGGGLSIFSRANLPALETVGGYLHINSQASLPALIKDKPSNAKERVQKAFTSRGYLLCDGILSKIISNKKIGEIIIHKTSKIRNHKKIIYVVQKGEMFSHGETVKQASHDLRYKLADKDTTKYKGWTLSGVHPIADIIGAYRTITGACETGTKQFCEGKDIPSKMSVKEAIVKTKGAWGGEKFAGFFKEAK